MEPSTFSHFQLELARLVDRFEREHPHFTSPDYNEATVRADYVYRRGYSSITV